MTHHASNIPSERLMEAVDAISEARLEMGGPLPAPPAALMGAPMQPAAFVPFTRTEITEAAAMLGRMGLLHPSEQQTRSG